MMATREESEELNRLRDLFRIAKKYRESSRSVTIEAVEAAEEFADEESVAFQEMLFELVDELDASGVVKAPSP